MPEEICFDCKTGVEPKINNHFYEGSVHRLLCNKCVDVRQKKAMSWNYDEWKASQYRKQRELDGLRGQFSDPEPSRRDILIAIGLVLLATSIMVHAILSYAK